MSVAIVVGVLLYFLLASGDLFLRKLVNVLPSFRDKKRAVEMAREMERQISTYLFTVTLINLGVGVAVGTGVALLGMPNPILWGFLACVLTYVPYLGAAVGISILALASVLTFDDLGHALAVPAVYAVVSFLEGNLVTPAVLGNWAKAITTPSGKDAAESLLRLEMAAEVPTPAEHISARRMLQLQLLTKRNAAAPVETWGDDTAKVLASQFDGANARRVQNVLKVLLKR